MPPKRKTPRTRGRASMTAVQPAVPQQTLGERSVDDIDLDPLNPRLPEEVQGSPQDELLAYIARNYEPLEIAGSIARHGYFISEPIIVFEEAGRAVAVEGNRRLTALKLLAQPQRAADLGLEDAEEWEAVAAGAELPTTVPVVVVKGREAVAPIVGYRHISGIEPWEPFAKARFLANLVDRDGMSFEDAAAIVGESERAVREQYRNFRIARQLKTGFKIDARGVERRFGVFTRAMQDSRILAHIKAPASGEVEAVGEQGRILPTTARANANELVDWVFGAGDTPPLFTDSRKISTLGTVVASKTALARLRKTGDLDDAFEAAGGPQQQLIGQLDRVNTMLRRAAMLAQELGEKASSEEIRDAVSRCTAALKVVQATVG